jgi:DNA-binding MarR family transcriptional regulator
MERFTMSRNLAVMEDRGWIAPHEVSATGRSMTVVVTDAGKAMLVSAEAAWSDAQAAVVTALGPGAATIIDEWLGELAGS